MPDGLSPNVAATAKLSDVASINPRMGEKPAVDDLVSFVPMAALSAETASVVAEEAHRYGEVSKGYTPFKNGYVLVAKITPCFENNKIGQAKLTRTIGLGSTEFHVVRPHLGQAEARYLMHFLRQDHVRREGERKMTGSAGQRRVPEHVLADLDIPLPSLTEQRRIAAILDGADTLRAKRRAALAQLDEMAQAIFVEMFGSSEDLGGNDNFVELGDLMAEGPQNGIYKPGSNYGEGTPIVRIDCFYDGAFTKLDQLKRVRLLPAEVDSYALNPGDIVINRVNSIEYVGKAALIPALPERTVFESNMMRFAANRSLAHPVFINQALRTPGVRTQIQASAKQAINQASINQQDVARIRLPRAPLQRQVLFATRLEALDRLRSVQRSAETALDSLFASIQHRAFTGAL